LNGKPIPPVYSSGHKYKGADVPNVNAVSSATSSSPNFARPSERKVVFGSNFYRTKETGKVILLLLLNAFFSFPIR